MDSAQSILTKDTAAQFSLGGACSFVLCQDIVACVLLLSLGLSLVRDKGPSSSGHAQAPAAGRRLPQGRGGWLHGGLIAELCVGSTGPPAGSFLQDAEFLCGFQQTGDCQGERGLVEGTHWELGFSRLSFYAQDG